VRGWEGRTDFCADTMTSLKMKTISSQKKHRSTLTLLVVGLALSVVAAARLGAVPISHTHILQILLHKIFPSIEAGNWPAAHEQILLTIRLPRIILAVLVGASLGISGTTLQGVLRNPLADPYLIGLSSGAALGASLAIVISKSIGAGGYALVPLFAFIGGVISLFIVFTLARRGQSMPATNLILAGVATSAFFSAIVSLLIVLHGDRMEQIIFWMMGGLAQATWRAVAVVLVYLIPGTLIIFLYARALNVMALGETSAHFLGLHVEAVKRLLLVAATLITAAAVSVTGLIGFVGLIIPHMFRRIVGPDHRLLLPTAALGGAILMVLADTIARTALIPREIPVGVLTALCGAPFFLYLLKKTV
jgi:iron complex transport system permease protein